jgi:hypothetical protein
MRPSFWQLRYPLNHPQVQTQGAPGSCFVNQRPLQGQCLVQACRDLHNLTSLLEHTTSQIPHGFYLLL